MKSRLEKKRGHTTDYSIVGFFDSFRRAFSTVKDISYTTGSSSKSFNSLKEEKSFQIQAELSRNDALLREVMIPPR